MIADDTIDRVRREARIAELVGDRVKLERRGRSLVGLCPFHKEKTPSFHVNDERGFYHCFGCGASGDAIKFIRELDGMSFVDAVRYIAEREGIDVVETGSEQERRQQAEARRQRDELYGAGAAAAEYFERMLREHPLRFYAVDELERRGLDASATEGPSAEALRAFRIGYAPYGWDGLGEHFKRAGVPLRAAEKVGLLAPRKKGNGHYDRFRHRLMFAVMDLEGRIVAFSGRALPEPTDEELGRLGLERMGRGEDKPAKYVNSPESPVYKKREVVFGLHQARQHIRQEDGAIVVEGNFDVVSLHARGLRNVVAPLGTAFTAEQGRQLRRYSSNVTLLFDGDEAGRRAVHAARQACDEAGLFAKVAALPEGTDPDDLVRHRGTEALERCLGAARSLLEYLIDSTLDRGFSSSDAKRQAATVRQVAALIAAEDDPTARALAERHADRIAQRLAVGDARTFRALASAVHKAVAESEGRVGTPARERAAPPETARSRDRRRDVGLEIFGAILDFPALLDSTEVAESLTVVEGELASAIAALRHHGSTQNLEQLLAKLPTSIHSFAAARLVAPRHERIDDAKSELLRNVEKLKRLELSRQKSEVLEELERIRASGDFDRELELLREQELRARQRHGL